VENHDTDRTDPIVQNKMLGYAYILTSEGYPCVFYKDYSTDKFCFGLQPHIDKLIFVHEQIAQGASLQRFKNFEVFAFERLGGPHLLTGLNNDPNKPQTITVFTGFGSHVHLHDYAGHAADVQTDGAGRATITIPQNKNGLGYVCYSRPGIGSVFHTHVHSTAQALEGAQDLDIKAAAANETTDVGRVFCKAGTEILAQLSFSAGDWNPNTALTLSGLDPAGGVAKTKVYNAAQQGETMSITAAKTGFFTFQIQAMNPPGARPKLPFNLLVTYTAPTTL
jgi:alpha-amylase